MTIATTNAAIQHETQRASENAPRMLEASAYLCLGLLLYLLMGFAAWITPLMNAGPLAKTLETIFAPAIALLNFLFT